MGKNNKKKTTDEFKIEIECKFPGEFKVIDEYINANTPIAIRHLRCGIINMRRPNDILNGSKCAVCAGLKKKTHENFIIELNDKYPNEFKVIGRYVNAHTPIEIMHLSCKSVNMQSPHSVLMGSSKCSVCSNKKRKTTKSFKKELEFKYPNEFKVEGEYVNAFTRIAIKHLQCGITNLQSPHDVLRGLKCSHCVTSKGEISVYKYLTSNNIKFTAQHKFNDCRNKNKLSFDFRLENGICIEYDGIQHHAPVKAFGGEKNFEIVKIRDKIKTDYCKSKNIKLIRIPYTVKDIAEFLDKNLA